MHAICRQIFNSPIPVDAHKIRYLPDPIAKRTVIQFAIDLQLTHIETDELLLAVDYALSVSGFWLLVSSFWLLIDW